MATEQNSTHTPAVVSSLPSFSGDGYSYGGGALVTFGDVTVQFGAGRQALALATEVAKRWDCHSLIVSALKEARRSMFDWDDHAFVAHVDKLIACAEG